MSPETVALIVNPKGGRQTDSLVGAVLGAFNSNNIRPVTILRTTPAPDSALALATEARMQNQLIVAIGGDGTIRQVAEALMGTNVTLAAYPAGTGNLFVKSQMGSMTPQGFVEMVLHGTPQTVDMMHAQYTDINGKAHDYKLLVALGTGALSDAICDTSNRMKKMFGRLAYAYNVARACVQQSQKHLAIRANTGHLTEPPASTIIALNVLPVGWSILAPGCTANDARLDCLALRSFCLKEHLKLAASVLIGRAESSQYFSRFRASEIEIWSDDPFQPNIDGDSKEPTTHLRVKVIPSAIKVILCRSK